MCLSVCIPFSPASVPFLPLLLPVTKGQHSVVRLVQVAGQNAELLRSQLPATLTVTLTVTLPVHRHHTLPQYLPSLPAVSLSLDLSPLSLPSHTPLSPHLSPLSLPPPSPAISLLCCLLYLSLVLQPRFSYVALRGQSRSWPVLTLLFLFCPHSGADRAAAADGGGGAA